MSRETQLILRRISGVILPAAALALFVNGPVQAQEESSGIFEEIVVLAGKISWLFGDRDLLSQTCTQ